MNKETSLKVLKFCGVIKIILGIIAFIGSEALTNLATSSIQDASSLANPNLLSKLITLSLISIILILSGVFTLIARKGKGFIFWAVLISAIIDLLIALSNLFTGAGADYLTIVMEVLTVIACFSLRN